MLDRETTDVFNLNISVTDGGQPRHTTYTPLSVHIIDVNDNPPVFQRSVYVVDVSEGTGVGSVITTVHAIDKDTGMVIFSLLMINSFSSCARDPQMFFNVILFECFI